MTPPRGASCAWCSIAGRTCCCRADVDHQDGVPLTYNKVLVAKPGYQFDNPSDFHDVRSSLLAWNHTLHDGASARLTMTLTPATTLVSLTAFRDAGPRIRRGFRQHRTRPDYGRDQHERQHQLSEEITISHQQPRLTWVGGMFLFSESDHQTIWSDQPAATIPAPARPARRRDQPRRVRTGDGWTDVPALGDRRRSLHARGEGHRQCRGALCPRGSESADSRFGLRLFRFHCPQRLDAQDSASR